MEMQNLLKSDRKCIPAKSLPGVRKTWDPHLDSEYVLVGS